MNGKDLFHAMQHLDTDLITEAELGSFSPEAFEQEDSMKHLHKFWLIAAIVTLLCLLMGCAIVYSLKFQNLQIGEIPGWNGQSRPVLSISGVRGSENYQAAQEWLDYQQSFRPDGAHKLDFPNPYEPYSAIYQEQADKLEQIAQSHGLHLAGEKVNARTPKSLLAYLNLSSPLLPDAQAVLSDQTAEYYEGGIFYSDFYLLMPSASGNWPSDVLCLYTYTPKTCMALQPLYLMQSSDNWREWNYTTASGMPLLILRSDSEAYLICDHPDAATAVKLYTDDFGTSMTDAQIQQIADQFNYALYPQPGDKSLLAGFGSEIDASQPRQTRNGYTLSLKSVETDGELAYVTLTVTAPEGTSIWQKGIHPGNRGEGLVLPKEPAYLPYLTTNWSSQPGSEEKTNTQDLTFSIDPGPNDATVFRPGDTWSLYIEGLDITDPNSMLQSGVLWQVNGIWQFDITIPENGFQTIEFLDHPMDFDTIRGPDHYTATLTSLKLRRFSATAIYADLQGNLEDYEAGTRPQVVLKNGAKISLNHIGGPTASTRLDPQCEIPLSEVACLELTDGTKLYPIQ